MGKLISLVVMLIIGAVGFSVISSMAQSVSENVTQASPAVSTLLGMIPIMYVIATILVVFGLITGTVEVMKILKWSAFGNRMKVAYSAKFGGDNPGFDEEVDAHIKAVKALGKGFTKSVDMDWLKKMAKFVEIPFVVPEEEYRSEEEKTRDFDSEETK